MNILAIKFDLNWFLTVPGMLITGGILLLLIALIIFIATSGGKKKDKKDVKELVNTNEGVNSVTPSEQVVNPAVVEPIPTPIVDQMPQQVTSEVVEPVTPQIPIEPVVVPEPTVTVQETQAPIEATDISPNFVPPVIETQVPEVTPMVETPVPVTDNAIPAVSIYGGVSPIVPNVNQEPTERPIYGGANPMDATQSIPVVEPTQHVEYGVPVEPKKEEPVLPINENTDITNIQPVPQENVQTTQEVPPAPIETPITVVSDPQQITEQPINEPKAEEIPTVTQESVVEQPEVPKEAPKVEDDIEILEL